MPPQQQGVAATSPYLDEAFYAMVASHFPAMDSVPSAQLPSSTSMQPLAGSSNFSRASVNSDSSAFPATTAHDHPNPAQMNPYTAYPPNSGHRPSTSIYHPQPTRSGRVPIPPPEEELQAMLAMDNYFEFPSESESDDEDFVLPASELNDDDDEQEDDTPRHEMQSGPSAGAATLEQDEDNAGTIDSTEYDWLMENLGAMERNATLNIGDLPAPQVLPVASTSRGESQTAASSDSTEVANGGSNQNASSSELQPSHYAVSMDSPPRNATSRHNVPASPAPRARARTSVMDSRTAPLSELQPLPQQRHASPSRVEATRPAVHIPVATSDNASKPVKQPKAKTTTTRKRKASLPPVEEYLTESETDDGATNSSSKLPASPNARLEFKRRRNAEQSRTFRERQRAKKEAHEQELQALQDENAQLRQDLEALQRRLEEYEGPAPQSQSTKSRAKAPSKAPSTATRRAKTTTKTTRNAREKSRADDETPPPRNAVSHAPTPSAASALTFEDLGKFVAGLVQAKTQPAPALREDNSSERSTPAPSMQQNPLMLLTQLLSSHQ